MIPECHAYILVLKEQELKIEPRVGCVLGNALPTLLHPLVLFDPSFPDASSYLQVRLISTTCKILE